MNINIHPQRVSRSPVLHTYCVGRVLFALGRYRHDVAGVTLTLADLSGPRGGLDQRCRLTVELDAGQHVVTEGLALDPYTAVDRATCRAAEAVDRAVSRVPARPAPRRPGGGLASCRNIVVPYDFSDGSDAALVRAASLARAIGATLQMVHVIVLPQPSLTSQELDLEHHSSRSEVAGTRRAMRERLARHGVSGTAGVFLGFHVGETLVQVADAECADLIVIGTRDRGALRRALFGSVADYLIRHAHCPVMTVRAARTRAGSGVTHTTN